MEAIEIYTTPTCAYCKMAKEYMKQKGIEFKEYNVAGDRDALEKLNLLTERRSVPVITCGNDIMVGFDSGRLDQMISCAKQQTSIQE